MRPVEPSRRRLARAAGAATLVVTLALGWNARGAGLIERLARFLGLTAAPAQMRDASGDATPGRVWIADVVRGTCQAVTTGGGYRWPLFDPSGNAVIALQGQNVVRIPLPAGAPSTLVRQPTIENLVAFDPKNPDQLLVITGTAGAAHFAILSLSKRTLQTLPPQPGDDEQMFLSYLNYARGEDRQAGPLHLFTRTETRVEVEGKVTSRNVFLEAGDGPPRKITQCQDSICGQPCLSPDRRLVLYVESAG